MKQLLSIFTLGMFIDFQQNAWTCTFFPDYCFSYEIQFYMKICFYFSHRNHLSTNFPSCMANTMGHCVPIVRFVLILFRHMLLTRETLISFSILSNEVHFMKKYHSVENSRKNWQISLAHVLHLLIWCLWWFFSTWIYCSFLSHPITYPVISIAFSMLTNKISIRVFVPGDIE